MFHLSLAHMDRLLERDVLPCVLRNLVSLNYARHALSRVKAYLAEQQALLLTWKAPDNAKVILSLNWPAQHLKAGSIYPLSSYRLRTISFLRHIDRVHRHAMIVNRKIALVGQSVMHDNVERIVESVDFLQGVFELRGIVGVVMQSDVTLLPFDFVVAQFVVAAQFLYVMQSAVGEDASPSELIRVHEDLIREGTRLITTTSMSERSENALRPKLAVMLLASFIDPVRIVVPMQFMKIVRDNMQLMSAWIANLEGVLIALHVLATGDLDDYEIEFSHIDVLSIQSTKREHNVFVGNFHADPIMVQGIVVDISSMRSVQDDIDELVDLAKQDVSELDALVAPEAPVSERLSSPVAAFEEPRATSFVVSDPTVEVAADEKVEATLEEREERANAVACALLAQEEANAAKVAKKRTRKKKRSAKQVSPPTVVTIALHDEQQASTSNERALSSSPLEASNEHNVSSCDNILSTEVTDDHSRASKDVDTAPSPPISLELQSVMSGSSIPSSRVTMCDAATETELPDDDVFEIVGRNGRTVRRQRSIDDELRELKSQYDTTRSTLGETLDRLQVADEKNTRLAKNCTTLEGHLGKLTVELRNAQTKTKQASSALETSQEKLCAALASSKNHEADATRHSQERTEVVNLLQHGRSNVLHILKSQLEYYVKLDHMRVSDGCINAEFIIANAPSAKNMIGCYKSLSPWICKEIEVFDDLANAFETVTFQRPYVYVATA